MSGAAGEMKASLLLSLDDQLTGGLDSLLKTFGTLEETLKKLTGTFEGLNFDKPFDKAKTAVKGLEEQLSPLAAAIDNIKAKWHAMTEAVGNSAVGRAATSIGALGAAGAGISIVEPVRAYANYESVLRYIAITEGLSGDKVKPEIDRLTKLFGEDPQHTGQSSESIAHAYYDLVTTGIPSAILDRVIGMHSEAATAYNISPEALGPAVGALLQNFHVAEADIGSALSAMAQAAKEGRFKVEDFSRELPGVSGFMSTLGMGGREGADISFAALETVMKNASNPGQAAADFTDALNYLTGNAAKRAFAHAGVDLPGLLQAGEHAGKNPLDTILDKLAEMTKGQDPVVMAETLHAVLHNQQAEQALMALLQHREEFNALKGRLDKVDPTTLQRDFQTAIADPITQTRLFTENMAQLNREMGELFLPTLTAVTGDLGGVKDGFDWMKTNFPGLTAAIGDVTGVFLALVAGLGAIGFVAPLVTAGAQAFAAGMVAMAAPEVLAGMLAFAGVAGAVYLAKHADLALNPNNPGYKPDRAILPGQTHLPGAPAPDAIRPFGGEAPFRPLQLNVHVTADPGLTAHTSSDSPGIMLPSPFDSRNQTLGRP